MTLQRKAPKRPASPLSRERILAEALALVDKAGLEALSMRSLGARLGVQAMALYHHVRTKNEICGGIAELLVAQMRRPSGRDFEAEFRRTSASYREVCLAHPRAVPLLATHAFSTPKGFAMLDAMLGFLKEQGFSDAAAGRLFKAWGSFLAGATGADSASLEVAVRPLSPAMRALKMEDYPYVARLGGRMGLKHSAEAFAFGIEALLVQARRERARQR